MNTDSYFLEQLHSELKRAFKWMATATGYAQEGDFQMGNYAMTVAMQHWIKCQNLRDKYIRDEDVVRMDWKAFVKSALSNANKEVKAEQ